MIKVAIAALIPALIPNTFTINKKNSSIEDGVVNSFSVIWFDPRHTGGKLSVGLNGSISGHLASNHQN